MTGDALLVYAILAVAIVLFVSEKLRLDVVALLVLLALSLTGVLTPGEALAGFGDPVVVMIAALFVVAGGMVRTGLVERVGRGLERVAGTGRARATAVVMLGTGLVSAVVSTTGTVALMLPVTTLLARRARLSPSLLLLPMAVGALLGGLLTLVATPPNVIVANQLVAAGHAPFGFFDFTPIGLAMLGIGVAVLVPFAPRLLPPRAPVDGPAGADPVTRLPGEALARDYALGHIARVCVGPGSPLVGVTPADAALRRRYGASVVAVRRSRGVLGQVQRMSRTAEEPLRAGDELDVHAPAETVARLCAAEGLTLVRERTEPDAVLAEVLLLPRSRLLGRTLVDARFRSRYGVNVLSVRRQGAPVAGDLATTPLRFADTLLVAGSPKRIDLLRREAGDFVVVSRAQQDGGAGRPSRQEGAALTLLGLMLVLLTTGVVPATTAILVTAVGMVLAGCLDMAAAYAEIDWQSVVLIAAMLSLATALQKTGGVAFIVAQLAPIGAAGPLAMLAALFALAGVMGQFMSNTATAALVAPIAMGAARELGVSPHPLLMAVAVAASTSFATPMATPANMLVLGPGSYRFVDYLRVGLPLQLLCGLATVLLVPLLFPF